MKDANTFTLVEHLGELRKRIIIISIAVILCTGISFRYIQPIMAELISAGENYFEFIYISPSELFLAYIKVAIIFGVILSLPILLYQIWLFVRPGFEKVAGRHILLALLAGVIFFFIGALFCYKVVLPLALRFFGGMTIENINPMITVANYIGFVSSMILAFGLVFEMPMLVLLLSKIGIISSGFLKKYRKYVILIIFILSAILTPPDVVSQILLAIPMLILYEISILLAKLVERK